MSVLVEKEEFTADEVDEYGNISYHKLFQAFQNAAGRHVEKLGIGKDFYIPERLLYVLCRVKAVFHRPIIKGEKLILTTFAVPPARIQFYRDAYVVDTEGRRVISLTSLWVLISQEKRRIVLTDSLKKRLEPLMDDLLGLERVLDENLSALDEKENLLHVFDYPVTEKMIDTNIHMNNTYYFDIVDKCTHSSFYKTLEIDFEKECILGDVLSVYADGKGYISGIRRDELSFKSLLTD